MIRHRAFLVIAALACLASCARPPQAEIDDARKAMEAATGSVDVVTYAPDSLRAAQEKALALESELAAQGRKPGFLRRYETVLALARETAQEAKTAVSNAAAAKEQVAHDAASLVDELTAYIPTLEAKVWAAKRVPKIKLDTIAAITQVPTQARAAVDDARRDIAAGAYAAAKGKLLAAKDSLAASEETITEQTRIARSR